MTYVSVCSGIEAASVAWHSLGWEPKWFSELADFPSRALAHRWPDIENRGDFTQVDGTDEPAIDILVGGTPCQSFSVAGLRGGLADARGNLALEFLSLARRLRAKWVVWENVPGVLSSDGGRAFGAVLGGLAELGYGWAYRVLDAKFFGVPQQRRRVFVVGYLGDWRRAAAVLFERASLSWDPPPSRAAGTSVAGSLGAGPVGRGWNDDLDRSGAFLPVTHTLRAEGFDASEDGTGRGTPLVPIAFDCTQDPISGDVAPAMGTGNARGCGTLGVATAFDWHLGSDPKSSLVPSEQSPTLGVTRIPAAHHGMAVRRLTPRECERLQGFPEITESVILLVCLSSDRTPTAAPAEVPSRKSRRSASRAVEGESMPCVASAGAPSSTSPRDPATPADLDVLIDCERQAVRLLSRGRLLWSASDAARESSSPLRMPTAAFVRLAALTTRTAAQQTVGGREGSPPSMIASTHPWSGSEPVSVSGADIVALAADAALFTETTSRLTTSTTSEAGSSSPPSDSTLRTLCCCVAAAIASFIPSPTPSTSSFVVRVETTTGYTAIPGAKDRPRYRALGNSMAVPVMRWIGLRIAAVDAASAAFPSAQPAAAPANATGAPADEAPAKSAASSSALAPNTAKAKGLGELERGPAALPGQLSLLPREGT